MDTESVVICEKLEHIDKSFTNIVRILAMMELRKVEFVNKKEYVDFMVAILSETVENKEDK